MKTRILLIFGIFALFSVSMAAQSNNPAAVVQAFYKFHRSHSEVFNSKELNIRKKWFSDELNKLFQYELKREDEFSKKYPDEKPFLGDGFPFEPVNDCSEAGQIYKNLYKISPATMVKNKSLVVIKFYAPKGCGGDLLATYKIELVKNRGKWLINDWRYDDERTLAGDLKRKDY